MTRRGFLVVGAGPSGLGIAAELITAGDVTVVDRIPVTGGTAGWSSRAVRQLTGDLTARGVSFRLGCTALRWDGRELTLVGPGTVERLAGDGLFFAGGLRPATPADLGIDGDRPAGVLPATVAEHLLHAGVKLWDRIAILGDGPWAGPVAAMSRRLGTEVVSVRSGCRYTIVGRAHVHTLRCHDQSGDTDIDCDAVILAGEPRPNRNVEGALTGGIGVIYHQPVMPQHFEARVAAARAAARQWIDTQGAAT